MCGGFLLLPNAVAGAASVSGDNGAATSTATPPPTPAISVTPAPTAGNQTSQALGATSSSGVTVNVPSENTGITLNGNTATPFAYGPAEIIGSAAAIPQSGGVKVEQVIHQGDATSYSYTVSLPAWYYLAPQTTGAYAGSIAITDAWGRPLNSTDVYGWIAAPTATDANGNAVPTSYSVSGNTITQTTNTSGVTAWPVVADPEVTFGWVIYLYFNHSDLGGVMLMAFVFGAAAAAAWACSLAGIGILTGVCAAFFAWASSYFVGVMQAAYARGGGVVFEFTYGGWYWGYMDVGSWS